MDMPRQRVMRGLLGGGLVFSLAFAATYLVRSLAASREATGRTPPDVATSQAPRDKGPIEELVMVYLGAASCGWSNVPEMAPLLREARSRLVVQARMLGWRFHTIGIAVDWGVEDGLQHLRRNGPFDQVATGGNWGNAALSQLLGAVTEVPATPQVVIIRRRLMPPDFDMGYFTPRVADEAVLLRLSGLIELKRWVRNGAPVPALEVRRPTGAVRSTPADEAPAGR